MPDTFDQLPPIPKIPEITIEDRGANNFYSLRFGRVFIEFEFPKDLPPMPIGINWGKLGGDRDLVTLTIITLRRGRHQLPIPKAYEFDGASIPRLIRWAKGYERVGRHLWAALWHDWILDNPEDSDWGLSRVIGDAIFITLLLETGVEPRQSRMMFRSVRLWSTYRAWTSPHDDQKEIQQVIEEGAKAPETKAVATSEAAQEAKAETDTVTTVAGETKDEVKP